jgi:hypothetical protein
MQNLINKFMVGLFKQFGLPRGLVAGLLVGGMFIVTCYGPDGRVKWRDTAYNMVVNEGLQHILDILYITATSQIDPWYVRLTAASPSPASGDTLLTHGGWTEFTDYTGGVGLEFVDVRAAQQVTNNASKASFAINQDASSIGGAYLSSVSSGTSGTLLCVAAFTGGNKAADDGDTLEVEYQFSAADDGV